MVDCQLLGHQPELRAGNLKGNEDRSAPWRRRLRHRQFEVLGISTQVVAAPPQVGQVVTRGAIDMTESIGPNSRAGNRNCPVS